MLKYLSCQQKESIDSRLKQLRHGETAPGADAPKPAAFPDAETFTGQLPSPLSEMPHISLADDGELRVSNKKT